MKITMMGAGYVGLTTGACLAELGHDVTCVDIDTTRTAALSGGQVPIYEPGLDELVQANMHRDKLRFSSDIESAAGQADAVFLTVGTPLGPKGDIDLSYVEAAARHIAKAIPPSTVVVVKSTVVVGTCRWLREVIAEERCGLDFSVASNPEFLREGSAIADFMQPDRIVIGADDRRASALLESLYKPLAKRGIPLLLTSTANAELIKYAANTFLALKIGFINDMANLCENSGGDVMALAEAVGLDRRIGRSFLTPGPGFGGSCFPKDIKALAATGRKHGAPQLLVEALIEENENRKVEMARRVIAELSGTDGAATVAVLGLAFKANTDDVREAPSLTIIPILQDAGINVRAHDPRAMKEAARHLTGVEWCESPYAAIDGADITVILTEWDVFKELNLDRLSSTMRGRTLVDFRNLLEPAEVARHGLRYVSLGRITLPEPRLSRVTRPAAPRTRVVSARAQARNDVRR
jgi:UDPglucose 6-dehydrogenase